jgi:predicted benzoate:H+ symporter BenE
MVVVVTGVVVAVLAGAGVVVVVVDATGVAGNGEDAPKSWATAAKLLGFEVGLTRLWLMSHNVAS